MKDPVLGLGWVAENEIMDITCGVPQGSVLGLLLWNLAYDSVFRLPLPRGTLTTNGTQMIQ